jgi:hypothetical protein
LDEKEPEVTCKMIGNGSWMVIYVQGIDAGTYASSRLEAHFRQVALPDGPAPLMMLLAWPCWGRRLLPIRLQMASNTEGKFVVGPLGEVDVAGKLHLHGRIVGDVAFPDGLGSNLVRRGASGKSRRTARTRSRPESKSSVCSARACVRGAVATKAFSSFIWAVCERVSASFQKPRA